MKNYYCSLIIIFFLSCSTAAQNTDDKQICIPGKQFECDCSNNEKGTRYCNENGASYSTCMNCKSANDNNSRADNSLLENNSNSGNSSSNNTNSNDNNENTNGLNNNNHNSNTLETECNPICESPNYICNENKCICAPEYHDGGDEKCVAESTCSNGYAISEGETECKNINEVCIPDNNCLKVSNWNDSICNYIEKEDGESCLLESDQTNECQDNSVCENSICVSVLTGCEKKRPILFIHGVNGNLHNWDIMIEHLKEDGWPDNYLFAYDFEDPKWGCNRDNADTIAMWVQNILQTTGEPRIDLVAHSMGTLSSRYYVKNLGGHEVVNTYVTMGGQHHGLRSPC